jgi:hypothetical protein
MSIADQIFSYECGELTEGEVLSLFAELIKTKMYLHLQGHYGRRVKALIQGGFIDSSGNILKEMYSDEPDSD